MYRRLSLVTQGLSNQETEGTTSRPRLVGTFFVSTEEHVFHYRPNLRCLVNTGSPFSTDDTTAYQKNLEKVLKFVKKHFLPKIINAFERSVGTRTNLVRRKKVSSEGYTKFVKIINDGLGVSVNKRTRPYGYEVIAAWKSEKRGFLRSDKLILLVELHQVALMPTSFIRDNVSWSAPVRTKMPSINLNSPVSSQNKFVKTDKKIDPLRSPPKHRKKDRVDSPVFSSKSSVSSSTSTGSRSNSSLSSMIASTSTLPFIPALDLLSQSSVTDSESDFQKSFTSVASNWSDNFVVMQSNSSMGDSHSRTGERILFVDFDEDEENIDVTEASQRESDTFKSRLVDRVVDETMTRLAQQDDEDVSLALSRVFTDDKKYERKKKKSQGATKKKSLQQLEDGSKQHLKKSKKKKIKKKKKAKEDAIPSSSENGATKKKKKSQSSNSQKGEGVAKLGNNAEMESSQTEVTMEMSMSSFGLSTSSLTKLSAPV